MSSLDVDFLAQSLFLLLGESAQFHTDADVLPADYLEDIDTLERGLQMALSQTRTLKKATPKMNRLPFEVLAHIFVLLQHENTQFPFFRRKLLEWLVVTRVCRHWRAVAHSSPCLWTFPVLQRRTDLLGQLYLERSAQSSLRVYLDDICPRSMTAHWPHSTTNTQAARNLEVINNQGHRLVELHLNIEWTSYSPEWSDFAFPAPQLETLTIGAYPAPITRIFSLPLLFLANTPSLKRVILCQVSGWQPCQFQNLTHFHLYQQRPNGRVTLPFLLDFLRQSPFLEELIIVNAGPNVHGSTWEYLLSNPVHLTSLRLLEVGVWIAGDLVPFLSCLAFPSEATRCFWAISSMDSFRQIVSADTHFQLRHAQKVIFTGKASDNTVMFGARNDSLYIHGISPMDSDYSRSLFSDDLLPNVTELVLCMPFTPDTSKLVTIFRGLPSLATLTVSGPIRQDIHRLFRALGLFLLPSEEIIAPALSSLQILQYSLQGESEPPLNALALALLGQTRMERGCPIQHLVIEGVEDEHFDLLEASFSNVKVVDRRLDSNLLENQLLDEMYNTIHNIF